jgi:hypothetical protein
MKSPSVNPVSEVSALVNIGCFASSRLYAAHAPALEEEREDYAPEGLRIMLSEKEHVFKAW